jgi:SAM-dependent methyltransferase
MDDVARFNQQRWQALADADALFTRPSLDLDAAAARAKVDPDGWLGDVAGQRVLCLGGGGGQQSAAFGLLGAQVTVVDLSVAQLERDRAVAAHYGIAIQTLEADMRDLSALEAGAFDLVYQPYSINFVPDARLVFQQVARVLKPGGRYWLQFANPFVLGVQPGEWNGTGYPISQQYTDGAGLTSEDAVWVYRPRDDGSTPAIPPPREYRHTLSTVVNGLADLGFTVRRLSDQSSIYPDPAATPGTWDHFVAIAPPWLVVLCDYRPS